MVLGIPRGGVTVADIIARKLSCEFDIIIPRKLRAPHSEELAIGAVIGRGEEDGSATYLNDTLVKELEVSQEYIQKEKAKQIEEIKRRYSLYQNSSRTRRGGGEEADQQLKEKTVILADDGAATGATLIAAARWIKNNNPGNHLIIAIPVAPKETLNLLKREADHVEVILSPSTSNFKSVGQYYQSFEVVTDE